MMHRKHAAAVVLFFLAVPLANAADKFSAKVAEGTPPPKEVADEIAKLLTDRAIQVLDDKGEVVAEVWGRKEVPAKATEAQVKNGLTYRQIPETSVLGVVRLTKQFADYRKQKVPAGVYTIRLAYQPMDGDHMGTAPYSEFCLVSPAADDKKPALMVPKMLHEQSAKSTGAHPGVFLLFPGRDAGDEPKIVSKGTGHFALLFKQDLLVDGKKVPFGFALNLFGHSPSA